MYSKNEGLESQKKDRISFSFFGRYNNYYYYYYYYYWEKNKRERMCYFSIPLVFVARVLFFVRMSLISDTLMFCGTHSGLVIIIPTGSSVC